MCSHTDETVRIVLVKCNECNGKGYLVLANSSNEEQCSSCCGEGFQPEPENYYEEKKV